MMMEHLSSHVLEPGRRVIRAGCQAVLVALLLTAPATAAFLDRVEGIVQLAALDSRYLVIDGIRYVLAEDAYVIDAEGSPVGWERLRPGVRVSLIDGPDGVSEIMLEGSGSGR
ncbi:MAG: hypothetical protein JJT85_07015 [Chromatiales bacterium]|nr:hypothetical protein [Chromatiales bacterium]